MYLGINIIWDYLANAFSSFKSRVLADAGTFENDNAINDLTAELLQEASLVITPNGVKTSKLYAIKPEDGSGDLAVTRATTATRVNASGIREVVPANTARIDYSTGKGMILVEPQRTNLVFPSNVATTQTRAVTAKAYTLSFYGTGNVVLSGAFSGTLNGTGANNRVTLTFTPTAGNLTLTVNGTVTDWQLEEGSSATSYIPTTSASVTRNADVISKSEISSLIGQTEGTMFIESKALINGSDVIRTFSISDGTNNNMIAIEYGRNVNTIFGFFNVQGVTYTNNANVEQTQFNKITISWQQGSLKLYVNGNLIFNRKTFPLVTGSPFSQLRFTRASGDRVFESEVKQLLLFKRALTDAEAIQLTTL